MYLKTFKEIITKENSYFTTTYVPRLVEHANDSDILSRFYQTS